MRILPAKAFFRFVEMNPSLQLLRRIFSLVETIYFTWEFFSAKRKLSLIWVETNFFKTRTYSCWWKLVIWLMETISSIFSGNTPSYFSRSPSSRLVEMHFFCFFHASRNHYLNYRQAFLKLCHRQPFSLIIQIFLSMEAVFPLV